MRILYLTHSLPYGRGEGFVIPEIQEIESLGHTVLVVPLHPAGELIHKDASSLSVETKSLWSPTLIRCALRVTVNRPFATARICRTLLRARTWTQRIKNLVVLPKGLWLANLAKSWEADVIHVHWATAAASAGLVAATIADIPWGFTAHRFDIDRDNLLTTKSRRAQFVRAISRAGRDKIRYLIGGCVEPVVIRMGVDLPEMQDRQAASQASETLLMAANFKKVKGHRYLLEALSLLRDRGQHFRLDLAGGGALVDEVKEMVSNLGLISQVRFLGVVSHDALLRDLERGRWAAMVLPSIRTDEGNEEGVPVSLMEAMARRVPVISTDTGSIPELLSKGAGIIVPERSPEALAGAMEKIMDSAELRSELGQRGRDRIRAEFDIGVVACQLVHELTKATKSDSSGR